MTKKLGESVHRAEALPPRSLRVLIADDDRDAVLTFMMLLRLEGHETRGVYSGREVLNAVSQFEPDAVFLDIHMPQMSGYEVARQIRRVAKLGKPLLLIGVSGVYKSGADRVLAEITGFDHYLTKPYELSDILSLLAPLRLPRHAAE